MSADKKGQIDKFKQAARELETDDDEQRFKERLAKVAKAPRPPEAQLDTHKVHKGPE